MKNKSFHIAAKILAVFAFLSGLAFLVSSCTPPAATYSTQKEYVTPQSQEERCQWAEKNYRIKADAVAGLKAGKEYTDHQANQQKNAWNGVTGHALGDLAVNAAETEVEIAHQQMIQMCSGLR